MIKHPDINYFGNKHKSKSIFLKPNVKSIKILLNLLKILSIMMLINLDLKLWKLKSKPINYISHNNIINNYQFKINQLTIINQNSINQRTVRT
jgi:hypothetical protein